MTRHPRLSAEDFKLYLDDDAWWGKRYWEDVSILVNGEPPDDDADIALDIPAGSIVTVMGGFIEDDGNRSPKSVKADIRAWLAKRDTLHLVVSVKPSRLEAVKTAIQEAGGKVETT